MALLAPGPIPDLPLFGDYVRAPMGEEKGANAPTACFEATFGATRAGRSAGKMAELYAR